MKKLPAVFILLALSFLYTRPFFEKGFFQTHDGEWAIIRLSEMKRELRDGQFPARWSDYLNHGYGYPLFHYTYPLPFYMGAAISSFHISLVSTIKILFIASVIFSAWGMFFLGGKLFSPFGGFLAAVFYITAPFRLVDLYVRGSIGESLSLAIFPWLFYFTIGYIRKPDRKNFIATVVLLGALATTHNIMALLFFPLWFVFCYIVMVFYHKNIKQFTFRYILPIILFGISVAAFFVVPAIGEKKLTLLSVVPLADVRENFVQFSDFIKLSWEFSGKPSFQLGWAHIAAFGIAICAVFLGQTNKKYRIFSLFFLFSSLTLVFLSNDISFFFWKYPPLSWIDFPWRLVTPLIFILSLSTSALFMNTALKGIGSVLVLGAIISTLSLVQISNKTNKPDSYYETNDATTTSMDELMPLWVVNKPKNRAIQKVEVVKGNATIENIVYNSKSISFHTSNQSDTSIQINTIYFPGWQYFVNDQKIHVTYDTLEGLTQMNLPKGKYTIRGIFADTPVRLAANVLSFFAFSFIFFQCVLILKNAYDQYKK